MADELKPCPFCGCAILDWDSEQYALDGTYSITCLGCGAGIKDARTEEEAADAWNKGPTLHSMEMWPGE